MRERCLSATLLLLLATSPAVADERETVRTLRQTFTAADLERLELDLPVGKARIRGEERGDIQVVFELRCERDRKRCVEKAQEVTLESVRNRGRLALELRGFDSGPRHDLVVHGTVRIPAQLELEVEMGVGELEVTGLTGNVEAELNVGEVILRLPVDAVRTVSLDAGIGETSLRLPEGWHTGERSLLVGSETTWEGGQGQAIVHAEVGVGEVLARLE